MSREAKVLRNSAILALQNVAVNLIAVFVVGYIARRLGKADYGIYSLAFAFPGVFAIVGSLGLRPLTIREISADRVNAFHYLGRVVPARLMLVMLMGLSIYLAALLFGYPPRAVAAIAISAGVTACEQLSRIILDVFQAFEEMGKVAVRDVTVRIFTAVASVLVLTMGYGLFAVCTVYFLGSLLGLLINLFLYSRRFPVPRLVLDWRFICRSIREGRSYVVIGVATALYPKVDVLFLSKMTDVVSLATYSAASTLFYRLNFISDALATAVFPALSQLYDADRAEANQIFTRALLMIVLVSLPVAVGGGILAPEIIGLIYGSNYRESARVFSILICTVPFLFITTLLNYSLGAIRKQQYVAKVLLFGVVLGAGLNALLIAELGYIGAAFATLVTQVSLFSLLAFRMRREFRLDIRVRTLVAILASLAGLAVFTYLATPLGVFVTVPAAALVYYGCLRGFGLVTKNFSVAKA